MMKKHVHIRLGDIPCDQWIQIVLTTPSEHKYMIVPRRGAYLVYEAYFPFEKGRRLFNFVVLEKKFKRAVEAIPTSQRRVDCPIQFTFKRNRRHDLSIREWQAVESKH